MDETYFIFYKPNETREMAGFFFTPATDNGWRLLELCKAPPKDADLIEFSYSVVDALAALADKKKLSEETIAVLSSHFPEKLERTANLGRATRWHPEWSDGMTGVPVYLEEYDFLF